MPNRSSLRLQSGLALSHTHAFGIIQVAWSIQCLALIWACVKQFVCYLKAERRHSEPVRIAIH
jgi:hypothetical protein